MQITRSRLEGVCLIDPQVFRDHRGYFLEIYQQKKFEEIAPGVKFVQDNRSSSVKGTLRGLHAQMNHPQGKLISLVLGEIFDVVVDIRRGSKTFGQWESFILSSDNFKHLFVPAGFAHGFLVTSDQAIVEYKCTDFYNPTDEFSLRWNDPDLNIGWPNKNPLLSKKDEQGMSLSEFRKKINYERNKS